MSLPEHRKLWPEAPHTYSMYETAHRIGDAALSNDPVHILSAKFLEHHQAGREYEAKLCARVLGRVIFEEERR